MTIYGLTLQTRVGLAAIATVALGAIVYHFRIKSRVVAE
jgi:hypothetical protein